MWQILVSSAPALQNLHLYPYLLPFSICSLLEKRKEKKSQLLKKESVIKENKEKKVPMSYLGHPDLLWAKIKWLVVSSIENCVMI